MKSIFTLVIIALSVQALVAQEAPQKAYQPSDDFKEIVGLTEVTGMKQRLRKVHKLSKNLSEDERSYLWEFLDKKHADDPLSESKLNPVKNDIALALLEQNSVPENYGKKLKEMYLAKNSDGTWRHDVVWRDYCIQFIGQFLPICPNMEERTEIIEFIYCSMDQIKTSIPGTALIALNLNSKLLDKEQKNRLAQKATYISSIPSYGNLARMSAFHIAADHAKMFPEIKPKLLKSIKRCIRSKEDISLMMAAIASLGTIGDVDKDVEAIINKYTKSMDVRLRKAAYGAKKKLKL